MKLFYVLCSLCFAVVAVAAIEGKNSTLSPDEIDADDDGYEERRIGVRKTKKTKPTTKRHPPPTKKPNPPPHTTKKPVHPTTTTKKHVPSTTTTKKHLPSTTTTTKHPNPPPTKSTHPPRSTTKRPLITRKSRELCTQSILAQLNPTKSCKKGCLITCAKNSANTVGRCAVCRDECCEDNCQGYDCIPVSLITDAINTVLQAYETFKPDPTTQGEGYTEPPVDYEQTTVEEATTTVEEPTEVPEVVENRK
uniref:ARF7EP_C domain-containing protein n=1 Tax=Panagrellus redivivus TaxID=6233 RepID=A0A7E4W1N2_PANRE